MPISGETSDPDSRYVFCEDGKRPYVTAYVQKPKVHVGDEVYLLNPDGSREGPYIVASVPSAGRCTLSLANGDAVRDGQEVDIDYVEAA